ncbi:MAG: DNA methyltransferase [Candidatus Micrarchaeota archaeon]
MASRSRVAQALRQIPDRARSMPRRPIGLQMVSPDGIIGVYGQSERFSDFEGNWQPTLFGSARLEAFVRLLKSGALDSFGQHLHDDGFLPQLFQLGNDLYCGERGLAFVAAAKHLGLPQIPADVIDLVPGKFRKMGQVPRRDAKYAPPIALGKKTVRIEPPDFDPSHLQPAEDERVVTESTVWSFPDRGSWATHNGNYPGNFSPHIIRRLLELYTEEGDLVLDPMVGGGTTLIECAVMDRRGVGVDINPDAIQVALAALEFPHRITQHTYIGDARNLHLFDNGIFDFIMFHPPYGDIIKYSQVDGDLSQISKRRLHEFVEEMTRVAYELFRLLKFGKKAALLIGDMRECCHQIPLSDVLKLAFMRMGFVLNNDIIKLQHGCRDPGTGASMGRMTGLTRALSEDGTKYLPLKHEHLYVFRKPGKDESLKPIQWSTYDGNMGFFL